MKVYARRFNTYLALAAILSALCGCETGKSKQEIGAIYIHLQAPPLGASESVSVLRTTPVMVRVTHDPILTETSLMGAKVLTTQGGFSIALQFDQQGGLVLEQYSGANIGRHFVLYGQWGEKAADGRWLAAPSITQRITDGLLVFTPDCSREEADKLVAGLNAAAKKSQKQKKW